MATNWLDFNDAPDAFLHKDYKEDLKAELLSNLKAYLPQLLPVGVLLPDRFLVGNVRGHKGKSLVVELQGPKAGIWHDFATGEGGDVFDLWAAVWGLDLKTHFTIFLERLGEWLGVVPCLESSFPSTPSQKAFKDDTGVPTAKWDYTDGEGSLIACVYRYDTPEGKQFRPWDVKARKHKTPDPRPLYNQVGIKNSHEVILVEGEKCADALISLGICATTAMNGAKAPLEKTDWSPLKGKHVLIWPDNDLVGKEYATAVTNYLTNKNLASLAILQVPEDKPDKWDAAEAVAEGIDIASFFSSCSIHRHSPVDPVLDDNASDLDEDESPLPDDLISPRILTPGDLLVLGGAPKVGKSDFLLALLIHMAIGVPFLGFAPPRPLRIFYLQTEVGRHYMRERIQSLAFDRSLRPLLRQNLFITRQLKMLLNAQGVERVKAAILKRFPASDHLVDIIAIDPLRNVFDGGEKDASENNNTTMMTFLKDRVDALRDAVNPNAGVILAHHTRKIQKQELTEDPFQALSGAGSLRGYYSSGMILFRPDESQTTRRIIFELRNGPHLKAKQVDKMNGQWCEVDENNERITNQKQGKKQDAERDRKGDIILQLLYDEARQGRLHTSNQFAGKFENKKGLGGEKTIRNRINVLADQGHVKFIKEGLSSLGYPHVRSAQGLLCVQDMEFKNTEGEPHPLLPTHYKSEGALLPMENPTVWEVTKGEEEAQ